MLQIGTIRLLVLVHRQVYNAVVVLRREELDEASAVKKNHEVFTYRTKTENRNEVFGQLSSNGRPWGVENRARHLPTRRIRVELASMETFDDVFAKCAGLVFFSIENSRLSST